ncbi:MAG: DNA primase [Candidatus Omnitrophica bacterium]|nr:DNA primase [Candidatus Omnitrophota bacterium]
MRGYFPEDFIREVQEKADLVEVVSSYVPLKRNGRNFKALCPFHHEKTPSFIVSPEKQIYHCFGCGEGGDVFRFVMKCEKAEFPETVRILAERLGIKVPEPKGGDKTGEREDIYRANLLAADFFHLNLKGPSGESVRRYLAKRGLNNESFERFKLGFAPDKWDALLNHLLSKNIRKEILVKAGLVRVSEEGRYYDWFRNRLIFPIVDTRGRILGFGARLLEGQDNKKEVSQPKYINTQETGIFSKGRVLFGMNLAGDAIREKKEVITVEGYMDVILLHQYGVCNVVSVSGTALTAEHARLIHRYADKLIMLYDGDTAGESANLRGMEIGMEEGLEVRVACLPPGSDPDEFIIKSGRGALLEITGNAHNFFDYKFSILVKQYGTKDITQKIKICGEMWPLISRLKSQIGRSEYLKKLSEKLSLREQDVLTEFKRSRKSARQKFSREPEAEIKLSSPADNNGVTKAERKITALMLEEIRRAREVKKHLTPEDFHDDVLRLIVENIFGQAAEEGNFSVSRFISSMQDRVDPSVFTALLLENEDIKDDEGKEKTQWDCINKIKKSHIQNRSREIQIEIGDARKNGDNIRVNKLLLELSSLKKKQGMA